MDETEWQEQKSDVWVPEVGDVLIGVVIDIIEGPYGPQYRILTKENQDYLTASHKMLLSRMANVKKDDVVRIEAGAKKPTTKGNPLQTYRVWVRK